MTYDLRDDYLAQGYSLEATAEFDSIETIESLESALNQLGFNTVRIGNIKQLVKRLAQGERWDLVFNIAEGLHTLSREAQIPALLDAYQIPYTFSDTVTLAIALDKSLTKRLLKDYQIPTPDFFVVKSVSDLASFKMAFPVFVKPIAEGTSKGISAASYIQSLEELTAVTRDLLERYLQPVLIEHYLPGREFTVGIIGSGEQARVLGVLEIILREKAEQYACSFQNKENCEQLVEYRLVKDAEAEQAANIALQAWRALNCYDAGRIDLRSDAKGQPYFLEVNPLSGLHPTHSDLPILASQLGYSYVQLIQLIVEETCRRFSIKRSVKNVIAA